MEETIISLKEKTKQSIDNSMDHLKSELTKIRTGKASPSIVSGIMVDYYGNLTPINQVANVSTTDSRTISIQPWEKPMLAAIEQAIFQANLGLTPMNDGEFVRISIPPLTEERRIELVKQTKAFGEEAKVSIRGARHKLIDFIKKEVKNGYPEDAGKREEDSADKMVKEGYDNIDKILVIKEADIMKV
ncbi:MAG: ribosome recycling factor [Saprospiraceae bacterium]